MPKNYLMLCLEVLFALHDLLAELYLLSIDGFNLGSVIDLLLCSVA